VAVGLFGVLVAVLAVLVGRRGVLLGLLMLAVAVVVGRLEVVVGGCVVACSREVVMLYRRVLVVFGHDAYS
jgi:hypothetical protein